MSELYHWSIKKGFKKKKHKYIERLGFPGHYIYIYDNDLTPDLKKKIGNNERTVDKDKKLEKYKKRLKNDNKKKELKSKILDKIFPKKNKPTTRSQDQTKTNPKYDTGKYEYTNNCALCAVSYDLRRRGYDVEARAASRDSKKFTDRQGVIKSDPDFGIRGYYKNEKYNETAKQKQYSDCYRTSFKSIMFGLLAYKTKTISNPNKLSKKVEQNMLKGGEGSRYYCMTQWKQGGGHAFICEVNNGKVILRDSQTNERTKLKTYMYYAENFDYFRVDNIQPTSKVKKASKNRRVS